jgi:hypothetical protein
MKGVNGLNESDFHMADITKYIEWNHCEHSAAAMLNVFIVFLKVFWNDIVVGTKHDLT